MHQLTGDFYTVGEVLDAYHATIHPQPKQPDEQKAERQRASRENQKKVPK